MATAAVSTTNTITALGAGSGVDVKALANSLVEAERAPLKAVIDKRVAASKANISGYSALKFVLDNLKTAFADLKDQSDFASKTPGNSQPNALSVTAGTASASGSHSVSITTLAQAQRNISPAFAASSTALNGGAAFTLSLSVHGAAAQSIAISAENSTPAGIVSAINAAALGVTAQLINTGDASTPIKIMVTGKTGAVNDFTLSALTSGNAAVAGLDFATNLQSAGNAALTVNGVAISAASNLVMDAISGVTLKLSTTTASAAILDFSPDSAAVKTKLQAMVSAYNEANTMLGVVSDRKSTVETYGASLVGNSLVGQLRGQIRAMAMGTSSSPHGSISSLRDLGVTIDKTGVMTLDSKKLDSVLQTSFSSVVTMLSADRENLSSASLLTRGLAGDAVKSIELLLASSGAISTQSVNASKKVSDNELQLTKLEARMTALLERYNKQFAAMESIVGQSTALRTSLTSTFEGMMKAYTRD